MAVVELCHEAGIATYETENPPAVLQMDGALSHDEMLIGAIKSVSAQREIQKLQERHKMGMIDRIKKGKFPAAVPFGWRAVYDQDGHRTIQIDKEAAKILRLIFLDLFLHAGMGLVAIAERLNQMGYRTPQDVAWKKQNVQQFFLRIWRYAGYGEVNVRGNRPYTRGRGNSCYMNVTVSLPATAIRDQVDIIQPTLGCWSLMGVETTPARPWHGQRFDRSGRR